MGRRPAICNQITGFLPLYKNIANYTKSMFCIIEGRLTILARHILYNSRQTAQKVKADEQHQIKHIAQIITYHD